MAASTKCWTQANSPRPLSRARGGCGACWNAPANHSRWTVERLDFAPRAFLERVAKFHCRRAIEEGELALIPLTGRERHRRRCAHRRQHRIPLRAERRPFDGERRPPLGSRYLGPRPSDRRFDGRIVAGIVAVGTFTFVRRASARILRDWVGVGTTTSGTRIKSDCHPSRFRMRLRWTNSILSGLTERREPQETRVNTSSNARRFGRPVRTSVSESLASSACTASRRRNSCTNSSREASRQLG